MKELFGSKEDLRRNLSESSMKDEVVRSAADSKGFLALPGGAGILKPVKLLDLSVILRVLGDRGDPWWLFVALHPLVLCSCCWRGEKLLQCSR